MPRLRTGADSLRGDRTLSLSEGRSGVGVGARRSGRADFRGGIGRGQRRHISTRRRIGRRGHGHTGRRRSIIRSRRRSIIRSRRRSRLMVHNGHRHRRDRSTERSRLAWLESAIRAIARDRKIVARIALGATDQGSRHQSGHDCEFRPQHSGILSVTCLAVDHHQRRIRFLGRVSYLIIRKAKDPNRCGVRGASTGHHPGTGSPCYDDRPSPTLAMSRIQKRLSLSPQNPPICRGCLRGMATSRTRSSLIPRLQVALQCDSTKRSRPLWPLLPWRSWTRS